MVAHKLIRLHLKVSVFYSYLAQSIRFVARGPKSESVFDTLRPETSGGRVFEKKTISEAERWLHNSGCVRADTMGASPDDLELSFFLFERYLKVRKVMKCRGLMFQSSRNIGTPSWMLRTEFCPPYSAFQRLLRHYATI